ncbi:MAG: thioredoxin domain-containing protein [Cyclobacteriaceae bacterium]
MEHTNKLIDSTSPYLLQHAHNPVDWYPWGKEALDKALEDNKPILLSIGYSSCHWCHVMAHESFENDTIAEYMNEHFVNIKLDREERPDIDNIYMDAVQAMGLRGGWPLNVFLTPEQKPFYGGTYFPKDNWLALLQNITKAYTQNYQKLHESADQFAAALQASDIQKYNLSENQTDITDEDLTKAVDVVKSKFDPKWGGMDRAPKFPMPAIWNYLLAYSQDFDDKDIEKHVLFTLDQIEQGGIYDQVGGGFSRYSVDNEWHVPHFEKMLYDNGQLLTLYANAYKLSKKENYRRVVKETAEWLAREMMDENGGFYSALDADSEGVEGKFYVWSQEDILDLAGADSSVICKYYDIRKSGNWEHTNVLRRLDKDPTFATNWKLSEQDLQSKIDQFKSKALAARSKRIRPGLDDKIIAGWNGLALNGLLHSYQATGDTLCLDLANRNASFIKDSLISDGKLIRVYGLPTQGFLEDYAAVIQSFITYYETTFNIEYLNTASQLTDQVVEEFYDNDEKLFFYSSSESESLITRKKELFDNVIPSSNAMMAENLYKLGVMLDKGKYKTLSLEMLKQTSSLVKQEAEYMSYWSYVTLIVNHATPEIVVVGSETNDIVERFHRKYLPNKVLMAGKEGTALPLFEHKSEMDNKPTIYVCYDKTCKRPVHDFDAVLNEMK